MINEELLKLRAINNRRTTLKRFLETERLFNFLMWWVAIFFAWFLVGFGGLVIRDLPKFDGTITPEQFQSPKMRQLIAEKDALQQEQALLVNQQEITQQTVNAARSTYASEHSQFQNWLSTRKATDAVNQNMALIERTKKLETLKINEQSIENTLQAIDAKNIILTQNMAQKADKINILQDQAYARYEIAKFKQDLVVFGLRLLFVLPLLMTAICLFIYKRKNKYWPFVWGFIFFAVFSFFVELVPYLPSYGGYVRYLVGLLFVGVSGSYGISWMQAYLAQRKLEEQATESERRQKLERTFAIKKMDAHVCPSCDRHLLESSGVVTNFCVHCGLKLYQPCKTCDTRYNTFFLHCPTCGALGDVEIRNRED